jgi:sugar/nucleoside kinase (ribokinase family)
VTLDRFDGVTRPGGAALYAAVAADRLGLSAGILTSHGPDFPLEAIPTRIEVVSVLAPATTCFEHETGPGGRRLHARGAAQPLGPADVPADWSAAGLVLLAPVLDEVDPLVGAVFPEATLAASAQGWLRGLGVDGAVTARPWEPTGALLGVLQALVLSREDVAGQEERVPRWFQRVPFGLLTADRDGALLFVGGERYEVRPRPAREVDPTGAGDVFAATFMIEFARHGDAWRAAAAAACAGSLTVEGEGWSTVPDRATLDAALAAYERAG